MIVCDVSINKSFIDRVPDQKCLKTTEVKHSSCKDKAVRNFPGGPVVKNPSCNAGDTGSIPGRGTKIPHAAGHAPMCHNY